MSLTTRRLTVDDWRANRAIRLEALTECPGMYFTSLADAERRSDDTWRAMLMSATLVIFGLFDGDRLAGITAMDRESDGTASLAMSYLRPAWRGRGHSALLHAVRLDWARAHGIGRVVVSHRAGNEPSRRAILAAGFKRIGERPHRWPDGVVADNVEYALDLTHS